MNIVWLIICVIVVLAIMARSKTVKNKPEENIVNKSKDDPVIMNLHKDIDSVTAEDSNSNVKEEKKKEYNNSRKKNRGKKRRERKLDDVNLDIDRSDLHEDPVEIEKARDIEPTDLQKSNLKTSKEAKEDSKSEKIKKDSSEPENNIDDVNLDIDRSDLHEDPVEIEKARDIKPTKLQKSNLLTSAGALEGAKSKPNDKPKSSDELSEAAVLPREDRKSENIEDVELDIDRDDLHEDPVEIEKAKDIEPTDLEKSNLETSKEVSEKKESKDFKSNGNYPLIFEALENKDLSTDKIIIKSENTKDKKWAELYPKKEEGNLNFSLDKIKESLNNSSISEFLNNTTEIPAVLKKKTTESYEFTSSDAKDIENIIKRYGLDLNVDEISKVTSMITVDKNNTSICELTDIITCGKYRYHFENKF